MFFQILLDGESLGEIGYPTLREPPRFGKHPTVTGEL